MYQKIIKLAIELLPIQDGDKGNGGIYKIKSISDYPGDEDISVMNIEEQAVERGPKGFNFNENVPSIKFCERC